MYVIRKRLKLPAEQGIYLFVNGVIPSSSAMLNAIYEEHKDQGTLIFILLFEKNSNTDEYLVL